MPHIHQAAANRIELQTPINSTFRLRKATARRVRLLHW